MPTWTVLLGILGLIAGPTGGVLAWANFRTDRKGKEISQTGELIAMFRAYIDEMEKALERSADELGKERLRGNGAVARADAAEVALQACRTECQRMRGQLAEWERNGRPPADWTPPARD